MPAWDLGPFENDFAILWAREFLQNPGAGSLHDALDLAASAPEDEDLTLRSCAIALAAAAIVAIGRAKSTGRSVGLIAIPEPLAAWLEANASPVESAHVAKARRAIQRVRVRSELQHVWADAVDEEAWGRELEMLLGLLGEGGRET